MYITFKNIKYKNFLSTGNVFTEINMLQSPKTLIHGTNGSGKTTFVDALYFALFGKSFRKVKKDSVINYITKKNTLVELEFSIRKDTYIIRRGIKPGVFDIIKNGGKPIKRECSIAEHQKYLETYILHMNEKLFTQTVLLGATNYTPFMLLNVPDRRNVVEALLDIQIFSIMNGLGKKEFSTLTKRYDNTEYEIEKYGISIDHLQNHIDTVKGNRDELIDNNQRNIITEEEYIEEKYIDIQEIEMSISKFKSDRDKIGEENSIRSMITSLQGYKTQFEGLIKKNDKQIDFYNDHDICPTCQQDIGETLRTDQIQEFETSTGKFNSGIDKAILSIDEQKETLRQYNVFQEAIDSMFDNISIYRGEIATHESNIKTYNNNIQEIESRVDTTKEEKEIKDVKTSKKTSEKILEETTKQLLDYDTVLDLLKDDGIKTRIVKTYIPVINQLIKKYLDILDFPILFKFDEGFNEFIKVRGRDEVTFANLSEGERMRVNLALIFSFRELAKLRNATHCNLIIFDEVADSSLDGTGWDSFLKILKDVCDDGKQNTFIISHKGDEIINRFDRNIKFAKKGGRFSEIVT